ncbi:MAG: GNAT family N-acetyltransferase [Labilithrix sp.]|nr:GNAT family N-acetyltransferase [Labilithrix sp.]
MVPADLPAVGILAGRLVRAHHAYDAERFLEPVDPERGYERWFATQIGADHTILLVAADDAGIAGYVYARMEPRSYNELLDACTKLHDIYVDERARRRGVGEALLRETFRRAKAKGAPRVVLLTASQNTAAHRLFARAGFRTTMLEMTRELSDDDAER